MTLQNALIHFRKLKSGTTKKAEITVFRQFIHMPTSLREKDLSVADIRSIEQTLDTLGFNSTTHNKRHFTKALRQFQKYLKNDFSLITKRYYTKMGMGLGASFGVVFGIVVLPYFERSFGIAMGVALGMAIGLVIGHHLDSQAMAAGKVL